MGKLCDAGYKVEFGKNEALITNVSTGKSVGKFKRDSGLYVAKLKLRNPLGFGRPE